VIHTVGPIIKHSNPSFNSQIILQNCYQNSLKLEIKNSIRTIVRTVNLKEELFILFFKIKAFPSISTGVYGYPLKEAAPVALLAVKKILDTVENVRYIFRM
jgi:O-acetyl-ADP-ribose deacetylase (regulator of RNase III)